MTIESYDFYDVHADRARLGMQSQIFSTYIRAHALPILGSQIHSILDLGCGEGQLGLALRSIYPQARLVGLDQDAAAIAKVQKIQAMGIRNVEFVAGDMEQGLPPGPFDLIYASLSLSHLRNPVGLVPRLVQALAPGGYLWIKDLGPDMEHAGTHPAYQQLVRLCFSALATLGAHMQVIDELRPPLLAAGLAPVQEEIEAYPLGGLSAAGRAILTNMLSIFYVSRQAISRVHHLPEQEVSALCFAVSRAALETEHELGTCPFANLILQRPSA
ncbi:MAG TPA: class I SAM-dependent methyltransferase [Chloroflexia bacterium]|nr:class I SAM-dependent methyltransferase [Chloroflexia bacterium]